MIERIESGGKVLAIIVRHGFEAEGVSFFTSDDNPLQLGILKHHQGDKVKPHVHTSFAKTIDSIQEVLHIEYGRVQAEFYDNAGAKIGTSVLESGDTILLISGGHGFDMLEDSKILEIKQGPYYGKRGDKEYLSVDPEVAH